MSVKAALMPHITQIISSPIVRRLRHTTASLKRKISGKPPTVYVFLKADDPYSHILLQELPELQKRFAVHWSLHMVQAFESDMFPAPQMLARYSEADAQYLAEVYQQPMLDLSGFNEEQWQQIALNCQQQWQISQSFGEVLATLVSTTNSPPPTTNTHLTPQTLRENEALRRQLGHYNSAMLFFENEWYWGVDRLGHLEARLNQQGLNSTDATLRFTKTRQLALSSHNPSPDKPLILYWSARSPYSYLALLRCHQLCEHYQIPLQVKPVMPMMMRNMPVPQNKKMYIFLDTKREAEQLNIPYGKVADPLGEGVIRCYALLDFARQQQRYLPFLVSFAKNVNAMGTRAETDKGMEKIVTEAGMDWTQAKSHINNRNFQQEVENNLEEMRQQGLWGVPCIRYGETLVWGQDRLAKIEQTMLQEAN